MDTIQAFHNDKKIKQKYLKRVIAHQKADNLVRGIGWEKSKDGNFRGCAVGCTLENYNHSQYPIELGIPEWLARLEDTLFEGMDKEKSKTWPEKFLKACNVGADLEKAKTPFLIFILEDNLNSMENCVFDRKNNPEVVKALNGSIKAVKDMLVLHKKSKVTEAAWSAARSAARSAAWSAESAESAVRSAWSAESAWSSEAAWSARSAAESARSAVRSAESAAESAAWSAAWSAESAESAAWSAESAESTESAWSAEPAESAAWSAKSAAYDKYANTLLKILKGIK